MQILISTARNWAEKHWDIKIDTIKPLPGEIDLNFFISTIKGKAFTFKISRPETPEDLIDLQLSALKWINRKPLSLHLPYPISARNGKFAVIEKDEQGRDRRLRFVHWVPGQVLAHTRPVTPELLEETGAACGAVCKALQGFDHPAAHRFFQWDIAQVQWTVSHLSAITGKEQRLLVEYFLRQFQEEAAPVTGQLRCGVIHNDANDYNVLVRYDEYRPRINGLIDFGDTIYTQVINELAIAISYGIMDKPNPLEAAALMVKGFHRAMPILPEEAALLYFLVAARLVISVTKAAINKQAEPENNYLLISEKPAWELLKKWRNLPAALVHYTFRHACGWEPCPKAGLFRRWAAGYEGPFLLEADPEKEKIAHLDLSVGSLTLGNNHHFDRIDRFDRRIRRMLEDAEAALGIGGYGEVRPFYTTDAYQVAGNEGPEWRTVHLGVDVWGPAGRPVVAPLNGKVHSIQDNQGERDYGPTIILAHRPEPELVFYTLYGHLSADSLDDLQPGDQVTAGQEIARTGDFPVNGNWPPHLHFQIILDLLEWEGDFPGVAFPGRKDVWLSICPDPALIQPPGLPFQEQPDPSAHQIQSKRSRHLGKSLSLSYDQPLHLVRGYGAYLYDTTGRRYLDTVNNVAHVGHEHPRIVDAGRRQMEVLNTNTRYLHHEITALAEELLATFPAELSVVYFVNSGSEANELALRMAQACHRHTDMIAVEMGYHGNTGACIGISSYKFDRKGGHGAPPTTQVVPMPDTYRGIYRADRPDAGEKYAAHLSEAIDRIEGQGRKVAGFICESVLSCGGQIVLPEAYLQQAYQYVRRAGGLCIADEVQVGFGRVGSHFWGFKLQEVVPDIVTMGKPMGNGHPLAAVVCTRQVADAFANGMEFFNTFGGNPVSCAIGRAVLKVIREEELQQNALHTGAYLRQALLELQSRHPLIGQVRGPGLFQGIELVKDPETRTPATSAAHYIANRMRQLGVLMSTDGPDNNVLKIKPPICFERRQANQLVETLEVVLKEDYLRR